MLSFPADTSRYLTRVRSSFRIVRSGVVSSESCAQVSEHSYDSGIEEKTRTSHSLKMLIVERPTQKISE